MSQPHPAQKSRIDALGLRKGRNQLYHLFRRQYKFYQPMHLTKSDWQMIDNGNLEPFLKQHFSKKLDRICIDRAIMIKNSAVTHLSLKGQTVLDLGCNTGFFSHYFARQGAVPTGIDSNSHNSVKGTTADAAISVIDSAKAMAKEYGVKATFVEADILEYLKTSPKFDIVLCLSLIHHFFNVYNGYGVKSDTDVNEVFKLIASKAKKLLYLEIDHNTADKYNWKEAEIPKIIQKLGNFKEVRVIGISVDAYLRYRNLYECVVN